MVNVVAHRVGAAFESDEDIEAQEYELTEVLPEVNPQIIQSCFGDWLPPQNSTDKRLLSKNLIKSFGALTIKRRGKKNSYKLQKLLSEMAEPKRYSLKKLKLFTWNFSRQIGLGGFGSVYKGEIPNGVQVAVKIVQDSSWAEELFMAELSILGRTNHRNIIKLLGFCSEANIKGLVYEYQESGSLDKILFHNHHMIDWEKLYHISIGTAKGISYLHEDCQQLIIHYDIKPGNILLDSNFTPKVADFGLAEIYDRDIADDITTMAKGTVGYIAPELFMSSEATYRCDVYSFGMMLFEMVGRKKNALDRCSPEWFPKQVWDEFENGRFEEFLAEHGIEEKYREQAKRMSIAALWCVQVIPDNRPSMSTVVNILKGDVEAIKPPNPFPRFSDVDSSSGSSDSTWAEGIIETNSNY